MAVTNSKQLIQDLIFIINTLLDKIKNQQKQIDELSKTVSSNSQISEITERRLLKLLEKAQCDIFLNDNSATLFDNCKQLINELRNKYPNN